MQELMNEMNLTPAYGEERSDESILIVVERNPALRETFLPR